MAAIEKFTYIYWRQALEFFYMYSSKNWQAAKRSIKIMNKLWNVYELNTMQE